MKVYLDDERPTPSGWIRAYWPEDVIELLKSGQVEEISLDHDLGDDDHGTGYDVVLWIEEQVFMNGFVPPEMNVHSANSSAADKMWAGIESIERMHSRNLQQNESKKRHLKRQLRLIVESVTNSYQALDDYGEVLFGDERGFDEPNTNKESKLVDSLERWFNGEQSRLTRKDIQTYRDLRKLGLYQDVLDPPADAEKAYRFTVLNFSDIKNQFVGNTVDRITTSTGELVDVFEVRPVMLDTLGRPARSWTIDANSFHEILEDWGSLGMSGGDWGSLGMSGGERSESNVLVFFIADVEKNKEQFLFNPDEVVNISDYYAYQKEVIQIGSIKLDGGFAYKPVKSIDNKMSWENDILEDFFNRA